MWAGLLRLISIAGLTTLINNVHDWLQGMFGTDGEGKKSVSPFVLLVLAAAIVYAVYKVLGKKIIVK
jgi:drug/metabolite transporter (DMT)-like permease